MSRRKKAQPMFVEKTGPFWKSWWASKGPLFCFGLNFIGLIAFFSAISLLPFVQSLVTGYLKLDGRLASTALNWLGQQTHASGDSVVSSRFAVTILDECSANEFVVFLWAGLLAFPTTRRRKIAGLVLGTLGIVSINLIRIVTLFLVGAHRPHFFATVHEELWPGLLSMAMILFVAGWASWATPKERTHAAA
ncbi:MAG TPA: archaeosortase/exosortase family protein [Opitutaceae bacterium]|jgi:exosortase family protein XrtM|nr:archaeosortase/exosortase family protein [Opitutaceae bacterium]